MDHEADLVSLSNVQRYCLEVLQEPTSSILPDTLALTRSRENLQDLPSEGWGIARTTEHLIRDVAPGLNQSSLSPRYYGFVTGGVTPGARIGECLVSSFDQNAQVHLPDETVATNVDAKAIDMLLDFFRLDVVGWSGLFTTGATASNILGLGVARECVINKAVERVVGESGVKLTVGEHGILHACQVAGVHNVTTLTTKPHSSLRKAASIVGLGRGSVLDVAKHNNGLVFDLEKLESIMIENAHTSVFIVVVSCGEVNTGLFATNGFESMQDLRTLCDRYGAWLHVDAAFGLFARLLEGIHGFEPIAKGAAGLELADSIAGDAHKLLNVPYDCGFFFHRSGTNLAEMVFQNTNAAYLNSSVMSSDNIRSPLNVSLENSRRLRGLPVYSTLLAYGRKGYQEMLKRQIRLARGVASFILHHPDLELLPSSLEKNEKNLDSNVYIVVLFKARDENLNAHLVERINKSSSIYVSGTSWNAVPASRFAIANWQVDPERDLPVIEKTLNKICETWHSGKDGS